MTQKPTKEVGFGILNDDETGYIAFNIHKWAGDSLKISFYNSLKDDRERDILTKEISRQLQNLNKEIGKFELFPKKKNIIAHEIIMDNKIFNDNLVSEVSQKIVKMIEILNPTIEKHIKRLKA